MDHLNYQKRYTDILTFKKNENMAEDGLFSMYMSSLKFQDSTPEQFATIMLEIIEAKMFQ